VEGVWRGEEVVGKGIDQRDREGGRHLRDVLSMGVPLSMRAMSAFFLAAIVARARGGRLLHETDRLGAPDGVPANAVSRGGPTRTSSP
jgi:hypothetical protein